LLVFGLAFVDSLSLFLGRKKAPQKPALWPFALAAIQAGFFGAALYAANRTWPAVAVAGWEGLLEYVNTGRFRDPAQYANFRCGLPIYLGLGETAVLTVWSAIRLRGASFAHPWRIVVLLFAAAVFSFVAWGRIDAAFNDFVARRLASLLERQKSLAPVGRQREGLTPAAAVPASRRD